MGIYAISRPLYKPPLSLTPLYYNTHPYFHRSEFKKGEQKKKKKESNTKRGKTWRRADFRKSHGMYIPFWDVLTPSICRGPGTCQGGHLGQLFTLLSTRTEYLRSSLQPSTIWHDIPCHRMGFGLEPNFISVFQHRPEPPRDTFETLPRKPLTSTVSFRPCF